MGDPIIGRVWLIMRVSAGKIKKERGDRTDEKNMVKNPIGTFIHSAGRWFFTGEGDGG
jgi:hypothetical protein